MKHVIYFIRTISVYNVPLILAFLSLTLITCGVSCSAGDRSYVFQYCVADCRQRMCRTDGAFRYQESQHQQFIRRNQSALWNRVLTRMEYAVAWSCPRECAYACMWLTIEAFQEQGYEVPQFFGKWPMIRILGMQEPASAVFSLLNLLVHGSMAAKFFLQISYGTPMFIAYSIYAVMGCITWISSTIFHSHETNLTEKMDYFGAFLGIAYFLSLFISRTFISLSKHSSRFALSHCLHAAIFGYALFHIGYLSFVKFDYRFNMIVTASLGVISTLLWANWSWRNRQTLPYTKEMLIFNALTLITGLLEVNEINPRWFLFDSHALWHASTALMHIFVFRFIIADSKHLKRERLEAQRVLPRSTCLPDVVSSFSSSKAHLE